MTDMNEAAKALRYFKSLQKEKKYKESGNIVQSKFDMKDILEHVDDTDTAKKLMMFFVKNSDDLSFKYFKKTYAEYLESMLYIIDQRRRDRALIKKRAGN